MGEQTNSNMKDSSSEKRSIGLLGCTGIVGQNFLRMLAEHPWFTVTSMGASSRSAGKKYKNVVHWRLSDKLPEKYWNIEVKECSPSNFTGCDIIFSALTSSVAGPIEEEFAKSGFAVFSNAKNHRLETMVPLVVPSVNPDHLDLIKKQKSTLGRKGFIVTNANCSTTGLTVALQPLHKAFGIKTVFVVTMQAVSGAGYPGVASLDIIDNVVPHISGEEEKLAVETQKILGDLSEDSVKSAEFAVSAHCNRVPVLEGHLECVSVQFEKDVSVEDVEKVLREWNDKVDLDIPSAPEKWIHVCEEVDRPQPRLDRMIGGGLTVSVGRIRKCALSSIKFVLLVHNTRMGAAASSILNAEFSVKKKLV